MKRTPLIGSRRRVTVESAGEGVFLIDGEKREVSVEVLEDGVYSLLVDGRAFDVAVREDKTGFLVEIDAETISVTCDEPDAGEGGRSSKERESPQGDAVVTSPMPGRVVSLKVAEGQVVKEGEPVVAVEAMKMENELQAPINGVVKSILVKAGDSVDAGQALMVIGS